MSGIVDAFFSQILYHENGRRPPFSNPSIKSENDDNDDEFPRVLDVKHAKLTATFVGEILDFSGLGGASIWIEAL